MEGNVDKLIANRMKKRGMSWTKRGGDRMARLINLRKMRQLHSRINYLPQKPKSIPLAEEKTQTKQWSTNKDSGAWLEAGLPALCGPHSNRPWVQVLGAIAHATGDIT